MPGGPKPRGKHPLTWKELREQLHYDPLTGWLMWKVAKPRVYPGKRAGNINGHGYRSIEVCGFKFIEHRLIWWWMTGKDPGNKYVDHKNRKTADNRWKNLRLATHGQNYVNSKHFGSMRGIKPRQNKYGLSYRIFLGHKGDVIRLTARTLLGAKRIRNKLERDIYGEFACTQR